MEKISKIPLDKHPESMVAIEHMLETMHKERFYGELNIKFEAGNVVLCRKVETIKL